MCGWSERPNITQRHGTPRTSFREHRNFADVRCGQNIHDGMRNAVSTFDGDPVFLSSRKCIGCIRAGKRNRLEILAECGSLFRRTVQPHRCGGGFEGEQSGFLERGEQMFCRSALNADGLGVVEHRSQRSCAVTGTQPPYGGSSRVADEHVRVWRCGVFQDEPGGVAPGEVGVWGEEGEVHGVTVAP